MELVDVVRFSQASVVCFSVIITSMFSQYPCTLTALKSNAITSTRHGLSMSPVESRSRRSLYPSDMNRQLVDKHNELRRLVGASDMEYMFWNEYLASMAADWADNCTWGHGQPERPVGEPPFDTIGQNLYVDIGTFDPLDAIQAFYDEGAHYYYDRRRCRKPPCDHYTQVVWSTSVELGCAYAYCSNMINIDLVNVTYLVCNYGPAGNEHYKYPFTKGKPCTACSSGHFWCDNDLCRRDCTEESSNCPCRAACQNCGTIVKDNCTCSCTPGWMGMVCSVPCEDTDEKCPEYGEYCYLTAAQDLCPVVCSVCEGSTGDNSSSCETTPATTPSTPPPTTITTTPTTTPSTPPPTTITTTPTTTPLTPTTTTPLTTIRTATPTTPTDNNNQDENNVYRSGYSTNTSVGNLFLLLTTLFVNLLN